MAEKRMFAKSIVLTDAFLDMPMSARCLYFTLGMLADDDGFVGSPKSIMRQCGASQDDMGILLAKRYVLGFDSGVIVIKHWKLNNYLQASRHRPTTYQEELSTLMLDEKGAYTELDVSALPETVKQPLNECLTSAEQPLNKCSASIDKNRLDKSSIEQASKGEPERKPFGRFVRLTDKEFSSLLRDFGTSEFYRRKEAVDKEENVGKDFVQLIREVT